MGLFHKRKGFGFSPSVLSESEIQKKLYGEFNVGAPYVEAGDRGALKDVATGSVQVREPLAEKTPANDLFSLPKEPLIEPDLPPRLVSSETKSGETVSRHVPIRNFERKTGPVSSESAPYNRFRYNRPEVNNWEVLGEWVKGFLGKVLELGRVLADPKQVALRRFVYWGAAVLAVFFLFWGVNRLNAQREAAMSVRYTAPVNVLVAQTESQTGAADAARIAPAADRDRPVVITPVVPKSKSSNAPEVQRRAGQGYYVIQVVTYPSKQDADRVVTAFRNEGLRAFVKENSRPSGRVFYLVLLGGFKSEAEAQSQLSKFRAKEIARPFQDAFIKSSRA